MRWSPTICLSELQFGGDQGAGVREDDSGAEFVADRKTRIGRRVHAYDRYRQRGDLVVERTYEGMSSARSTWTIHPVDATHSTLTIDAAQSMGLVQGLGCGLS